VLEWIKKKKKERGGNSWTLQRIKPRDDLENRLTADRAGRQAVHPLPMGMAASRAVWEPHLVSSSFDSNFVKEQSNSTQIYIISLSTDPDKVWANHRIFRF
jgi:hypothetical protein